MSSEAPNALPAGASFPNADSGLDSSRGTIDARRRASWAPPSLSREKLDPTDEPDVDSEMRRARHRFPDESLTFSPIEPPTPHTHGKRSATAPPASTPLPASTSTSTSLLSSRRPSFPDMPLPVPGTGVERARKRRRADVDLGYTHLEDAFPQMQPGTSPEDGGNFRRSLQIDMKGLVGDAVGNMSISPTSRDIVLAARRGLFIIDLESPLEVPRFLPQGGTWDVADVQWNPHPARAEYIVSTSCEKMLIWNLHLPSKSSIAHILRAHYRAITDINWHTSELDVVASTGVDSWIWAWDLRVGGGGGGGKPVFGLSAFKAGGTQVKWNRQDAHILASSHANEVLIWDRRKGSLPITKIPAHSSKIYGIDWSHSLRNEIVTCSLDKTIKTWDIQEATSGTLAGAYNSSGGGGFARPTPLSCRWDATLGRWNDPACLFNPSSPSVSLSFSPHYPSARSPSPSPFSSSPASPSSTFPPTTHRANQTPQASPKPKNIIHTTYPVWRARSLPFGQGVLSLAQRGETGLEMYARNGGGGGEGEQMPVEVFEGHTDVVKEFVWRRGGMDEFQLITWSKDRTLRFWPIDVDTMAKAGYVPGSGSGSTLGDDLRPRDDAAEEESRGERDHAIFTDREIGSPTPTFTEAELGVGVGISANGRRATSPGERVTPTTSFRAPPEGGEALPALSAPVGHRSILAEVRAGPPPAPQMHKARGPGAENAPKNAGMDMESTPTQGHSVAPKLPPPPHLPTAKAKTFPAASSSSSSAAAIPGKHGETMSRGGAGGKSSVAARMDALTWLSSVKVGSGSGAGGSGSVAPGSSRRGSSGSGADSGGASRSRGASVGAGMGARRRRSDSRNRSQGPGEAEGKEGGQGQGQSLQDEITSVLTKLASSKIKLEKHDLTKKRTCTLGLHGPWGESSSVFIRVTFIFPREYPSSPYPDGTPTVELERNPLISMKDRAFMLKRLKAIRDRRRPCLEPCLRFLLFADEDAQVGRPTVMDDESDDAGEESSEDEDDPKTRKSRDFTVSLLRNNKNLAEPRTSQGTFGPNGELVCFFRAPPRIVRNVLRGLSESPSQAGDEQQPQPQQQQQQQQQLPPKEQQPQPRLFQSPALLSDAVRRLSLAATDRAVKPLDSRRPENGTNVLRIMTNLLTIPHYKMRRESDANGLGEIPKAYTLLPLPPTRRSTVFIAHTTNIAGGDRKVAEEYVFQAESLAEVCERNADAARGRGRYDHERAFRVLQTLFLDPERGAEVERQSFASDLLARQVITKLYADFSQAKDVQMLAMLSALILQTVHGYAPRRSGKSRSKSSVTDASGHLSVTPKMGAMDYFSITRSLNSPTSPGGGWPRLPGHSPIAAPLTQSIVSSNSSRGSWSSLFNTGAMRQIMHGMQDSLKEGLSTPADIAPFSPHSDGPPVSPRNRPDSRVSMASLRGPDSPGGSRRARTRKDSSQSLLMGSRSWNDTRPELPSKVASVSFSSAGHRRPQALLRLESGPFIHEKSVVFDPPDPLPPKGPLFDSVLISQFMAHVHVYAEILFSWQLYHKRLELLKSVNQQDAVDKSQPHTIGLVRQCSTCGMVMANKDNICPHCHNLNSSMASCTICRLPVRGLSRSCLHCYHVTHISCWNTLDVPICPTGCGCFCSGYDGTHTRPSTRLGLSPPVGSLILSPVIS